MSWTKIAYEALTDSNEVTVKPRGNSMLPLIKSGQPVTISPDIDLLEVGDIVFCKVKGNFYLHLIKAIDSKGRYLIGNNKGGVNGWTKSIFGKVIKVGD